MTTPTTLPDFNPSGDDRVRLIKVQVENLFKFMRENLPDNRERSIAFTNIEQGAMWAVKSLFTDQGKGY